MKRAFYGYLGTAAGLFLTGLASTLALLFYPLWGPRSVDVFGRWWARWTLRAGRVRLEVHGAEAIDLSQPHVYVSNHQSGLDILILLAALPQVPHFVAKRELTRVPFLGWALALSDHILIDRRAFRRAIKALLAAAPRIQAGTCVALFPEGTRFPPGQLGPFKRGAAVLARAAGVPLVPVGIVGSAALMQRRRLYTVPGVVRVHIGQPVDPAISPGDDQALIERLRDEVARLIGEADPAAPGGPPPALREGQRVP